LGGQSLILPGRSVAEAVLAYARKHNVTKIIAGKPVRPRWHELLRGSLVDQLIRQSGPIDVYIISGTPETRVAIETREWQPHSPWRLYAQSLLLVAAGTLLGELVRPFFAPANLVMIYLLIVVVAAIYLGRGPSMLAAVLSVLAFDFFLVPPHLTLAVADTQYLLTFVALFVVSLVISSLTAQAHEHAQAAEHRAAHNAELYALSRDLAAAANLDAILQTVLAHVSQTFSREAAIFLPESEAVTPRAISPEFTLSENELAVADWAFRHGQPAGRGTDTLPLAGARYLPLKTARGVVGVLGARPATPSSHLTPDQRLLLDAFASQAALAIERAQLAEQAQQTEVLQATEKLQTALLNSISHDLRTPLVSILGALSSLQEDDIQLDETTRRSLIENAREEAERLNRFVGNLLDMTRIEAGALKVAREPCDPQDVIGATLERLANRLRSRTVTVDIPPDLPLVPMDFVLMAQALVNVLDNALKYSPPDTPVEVRVWIDGPETYIQVADCGAGIPPEDMERVFDKFYRVQRPGQVSGTGLGLSICKGIVEAHAGRIWAQRRPGGGTLITIALPLHPAEETVR
jgi:two-component system sensor histidine kinase KdpD